MHESLENCTEIYSFVPYQTAVTKEMYTRSSSLIFIPRCNISNSSGDNHSYIGGQVRDLVTVRNRNVLIKEVYAALGRLIAHRCDRYRTDEKSGPKGSPVCTRLRSLCLLRLG